MADFPPNPFNGQQYTSGTVTWTWDGTKWTSYPGALAIPDAPTDGQLYGRKNASWSLATGGGGGISDAPSDGSFYGRRSGGWTHPTHTDIADWTAAINTALAPYALSINVPGPSSALPQPDGTALAGVVSAWSRADHVHPTDTTRAAASALAGYLPLTGGGLSGALSGVTAAFSGATAGASFTGGAIVVSAAAGTGRTVWGQTAGSNRWAASLGDSAAESGSNAGSNFSLQSFNDAGVFISTPLTISRNNGWAYFNGVGATPFAAEAAAPGHAAIRMNKVNGAFSSAIAGAVNGVMRWNLQLGGSGAESGSNAGSDFSLVRYTDAGASIDTPFSITRSNGAATFGGTINGTTATFGSGQVNVTNTSGYASIALGKSASGQANQIAGYTGAPATATLRWNMALGDPTAEGGANAGSNFSISRYADAGGFIDTPFSITRSNGFVTVTNLVNTFLRHNAHSFQFNYVNNSNLNQFACSIDGSYNVVTKSVVVGAFSSTIDTWAFNVAGSSIGAWSAASGAQWTVAVSSDRRLKSNLAPSSKDALAALCSIPVYECDMTQPLEGAQEQHWDWALIADEVKPVVPLAVIDPTPDAGFDYAAMREYPLIPMLIRAVQQLAARVAELEARP